MKKMLALCMTLAMSLTVLSGCGGDTTGDTTTTQGSTATESSAATESAATATEEVVDDVVKEAIINLASEPPQLNHILTTSTGSMTVLRHVMDGVVMLDPNDEVIPAAAESWDYDETTLTYTFHLRQGETWSNGDAVTAHDFAFSWNTFFIAETAAPYSATWAPLILGAMEQLDPASFTADEIAATQAKMAELGYDGIGFKAVDDYTLQVTMTGPYPYFLSVLAFPNFYPMNEAAYNEIGADQYATEAEYMVTNGAYTMTSWLHENSIVFEKRSDYWDSANINVTKFTMEMIADTGTALNTYLADEIDMIGLSGDQVQQLSSQGSYDILAYDDGSAWYFEFNTVQAGLSNAKVRKALTLAIDAESFIQNVIKNDSTVAYSFVPPAISSGSFSAAVGNTIERVTNDDYTEVKALLEEGLAEEGMTAADLTIAIVTDEGDTAAKNCAFFQEQWKTHLGVEVTVEQMTYKNRLERMQNKDFSVVMAGWGPDYNDPMTFLDLFTSGNGNNHTSYSNPAYDELIAAALIEPDADARTQMLIQCEQILAEDMPIGYIYNRARNYITSDKLTGVVRTAFTDLSLRWADIVE